MTALSAIDRLLVVHWTSLAPSRRHVPYMPLHRFFQKWGPHALLAQRFTNNPGYGRKRLVIPGFKGDTSRPDRGFPWLAALPNEQFLIIIRKCILRRAISDYHEGFVQQSPNYCAARTKR